MNNYLDWYNSLRSTQNESKYNGFGRGFKSSDSILVFGKYGNHTGVGLDMIFRPSSRDVITFNDLPGVNDLFLSKPSVNNTMLLSGMRCDFISRENITVLPAYGYSGTETIPYLFKTNVVYSSGNDGVGDSVTLYQTPMKHRFGGRRVVKYTVSKMLEIDGGPGHYYNGDWAGVTYSYELSSTGFVSHLMDISISNSSIEVTLPASNYVEPYSTSDGWIESTTPFKIRGDNNTVHIRIPDNVTYNLRHGYRGDDGHRALVSVDGSNNLIIFTVGKNSRVITGFQNRYDKFGYWAASNSDTNLYIFQTSDGRPLREAIIWENIENPVSTVNNYPNTILAKYEHQGEHNPFKHWIGNEYGG